MKYLVPCLLVLPLITSCVEQDPYYEPNYYNPPPRVEVERHDSNSHYHNNEYHRAAPQGRVYHGHTDVNRNQVIVNPQTPHAHVQVEQNVHGHGSNNGNVVVHPSTNAGAVVVPGKIHGHTNSVPGKSQQSQDETQETTHGHN